MTRTWVGPVAATGRVNGAVSAVGVDGALDTITARAMTKTIPPICMRPISLLRAPPVSVVIVVGASGFSERSAKGSRGLRLLAHCRTTIKCPWVLVLKASSRLNNVRMAGNMIASQLLGWMGPFANALTSLISDDAGTLMNDS